MGCSIVQDTYYAGSCINLVSTPQGVAVNFEYTSAISHIVTNEVISYSQIGVSDILFLQTGNNAYVCSNLEQSLIGPGINSMIIPSGYFDDIGDCLSFRIYGYYNSGPNTQLIESRLKLGNTILLNQQKVNISNQTNVLFYMDFLISCRATGVTGSLIANGNSVNLFGSNIHMNARSGIHLDLTQSYLLDFTLSGISGDTSIIYTSTQTILKDS
jgi:hypothetical protein